MLGVRFPSLSITVKLSSKTKARLRRTAKRYARTSGKDWVEEVGDLYAKTINRRRKRWMK